MPEKRNTEVDEKIERRFIPSESAEIRVMSGEDGVKKIVGYAARFDTWSENLGGFREKIAPGAFKESIGNDDIRALFNHDPNIVLGRNKAGTLVLREDERGLWMEVTPPDTQAARDLMTSIDRGDISQQSFAFEIMDRVKDQSWRILSGREPSERTLRKVCVRDVSPATYPAYLDTSVALRCKQEAERNLIKPESRIRLINTRLKEAQIRNGRVQHG